jgi:hypothetical protein
MTKTKEKPQPAKLTRWNELIETVHGIPAAIAAAISTQRLELLKLYQPGPEETRVEEIRSLVNLIRVLLLTNLELQRHSEQVAQMTMDIRGGLIAAKSKADQVLTFARFEEWGEEDENEVS